VEPYQSPYFALSEVPGTSIVRVVRSPVAFKTVQDLEGAWGSINTALDRLDRSRHTLLVDIRLVTGRNDPEFEQAFAPFRLRLMKGFLRVAVLVSSPAGRLQVQRHALEDRLPVGAFLNPPAAIEWLRDSPVNRAADRARK
jgi:hypothetical protein